MAPAPRPVATTGYAAPRTYTSNAATLNQRAPAFEGNAEAITVTGSMLSTSNNQNANPVQIITSAQIQRTGATSLSDYLQRIPSMGSGGTYNSQTNGSDGAACVDLRNLGQKRVLVLIDGKRTTENAESACVDLNTIPVQSIQSVEILKDGGSELYGADGVAGVINIKLRHNINDGNVTVKGGVTDQGDNLTGQISAYKGWNFDHDRGNLTIAGQYLSVGGVRQRNRSWANPVAATDPASGPVTYGSSIPPGGNILTADGNYQFSTSNNGSTFHNFSTSDRYNYGSQQWLSNAYQDSTLNGDFHYDFNDHFKVYANTLYAHRTTAVTLAGEPTSGSVPPSNLPNTLTIPANDPYNPTVTGANGLYSGDAQDVYLYRRLTELGDRRFETATDTVTGMFGLKGEITHHWNYDVSYTYGSNQVADTGENIGNYTNLLNTYGIQQLDPSDPNSPVTYNPSVCKTSAGCVLSTNPFAKLTPDQIKYVNYNTHSSYAYQMRDLNLRINNNRVVTMPWKGGGGLGIAMGMEHRSEQLSYHPDPLVESGQSLTDTSYATGGGFNVTEGYIEGKLQLLHDVAFAKDLTIDAQGRYSSYSTFGGAKNWKASINWAPTRDISFRGTLGSSLRQPNVYELYQGRQLSYLGGTDPCAGGSYSVSPAVLANCIKHGVTNAASLIDANSGQVPTLVGGSSTLKPETGKTYTFGTVITPRWIKGFSASVEYWHYTLKNEIDSLSPNYITSQCYSSGNAGYCNDIVRSSLTNQITYVDSLFINEGGLKTSGIDFDLDYRMRLTSMDSLTINNNLQQLVSYLQQYQAGGAWNNLAGRLMYNDGYGDGHPRLSDYATFTWQHGAFSLSWMMHYTGGVKWNDGTSDLSTYNKQSIAAGTGAIYGRTKTPGIFSHDVSVSYHLNRWNFSGGVNNVLDKKPPYVTDSVENSASGLYGNLFIGRYVWLQAGVDF